MGFLTSSMKRLGCMCGKWFWGREDRIVQMDEHEFNRLARDILESLYYFIAIDCDERITFIGKEYAENLGATQEELIGRKVSEVITNTRLPLVLRAGKPELGRFMSVTPSAKRKGAGKRVATVCNRLPIYRYGDRERGEMVGVMAEGIIRDFQDTRQLHEEMELLRQQNELYQVHLAQLYQIEAGLNSIIGSSAAVQKLKDVIKRIAKSTITVCISGETGTGKELVANAIHQMSDRAEKPFVKINCAAIPKELLESELFGYEAGAFTGADRRGKMGRFELANHGTLLLDEIGEMPITLQAKLLRVIQEKEVERVGGVRPIPLDVRLICSTNRDLFQMVRNNQFRADLYYRLNTMEIVTPPLRERLEDIPELCELFLKRRCFMKTSPWTSWVGPAARWYAEGIFRLTAGVRMANISSCCPERGRVPISGERPGRRARRVHRRRRDITGKSGTSWKRAGKWLLWWIWGSLPKMGKWYAPCTINSARLTVF